MNHKLIKALLLIAYCVPYGYLAMQGDFNSGRMIFYGFMIISLAVLLGIVIRTSNTLILIVGNILSFISSYIFISRNQTEAWASYFKPFVSFDLLILITSISFIIQILFIIASNKRELKKGAYSIGIIGGANGPTSIFISNSMEKAIQEDKWNQLLEKCRQIIEPRKDKITGKEIKEYLIHEYDAKEVALLDREKNALKYNVIINHYPEALEELKGLENSKELDHFEQFKNIELIEDKRYNLEFAAFIIPRNDKTEIYYQQNVEEMNEYINKTKSLFSRIIKRPTINALEDMEEMKIEMELSTEHITLSNGGKKIMDRIILWKGVTQEDIDNCTPSFMSYAAAMKDSGKIIYNEKEGKWVSS